MINEVKTHKYRLALNLQTFAEDPPVNPPQDPPAEPPATVTMTQSELDALIAREKARAKKPYADYDDLKSKLSEFEAAEEERKKAAMTEAERLQAEVAAAKQAAEEAETARKQALETANQRAIKAEFKLAAAGVNIRKDAIDDAFLLVDKAGISVDDGGNVVGIADALAALVAAKPYLVEQAPGKPKTIGEPNNPAADERKTLEQQLADAKKRKDFSKVVEISNKIVNLK